jgi:hypothetical protein
MCVRCEEACAHCTVRAFEHIRSVIPMSDQVAPSRPIRKYAIYGRAATGARPRPYVFGYDTARAPARWPVARFGPVRQKTNFSRRTGETETKYLHMAEYRTSISDFALR